MFGEHLAGIYEKALNPQDSWDKRLMKIKRLGFDFFEISIDEQDDRIGRLYWTDKKKEELRRCCYDNGVAMMSMCLSGHRRFPFGSSDIHVREKAFDIMDRAIEFAAATGIRVIQLAGYDVYYEPSSADTIKRFREAICWAAGRAERMQVMLAMEIMDTPFMNSMVTHLGYEAIVRSPWYRAYPDMGNLCAWSENDPDAEFARAIGSIVAVHVKDTLPVKPGFKGQFKMVPFGDGCVDFAARFRQLEQLGYHGPFLIEMWYEGGDDESNVRKAANWLEQQFLAGIAEEDITAPNNDRDRKIGNKSLLQTDRRIAKCWKP